MNAFLQGPSDWLPRWTWALAMAVFLASSYARQPDTADLFEPTPTVHRVELRLAAQAAQSLRERPRQDVEARVVLDGHEARKIGLRLKGALGSFRPLDDRPSLTLETSGAGAFPGGITKLHLNNSVEDPSRLRERLGRHLFTGAGIPCPRVGHARVMLEGRDLGLYVMVEGCTAEWIRSTFGEVPGSVFEPQAGNPDVVAFREVARFPAGPPGMLPSGFLESHRGPMGTRWERAASVVDEAALVDFLAVELQAGLADGYGLARNNYRLWVPRDGRGLRWIPHGLDRLFMATEIPWPPSFGGPMAEALAASPEGLRRLATRVHSGPENGRDPAALRTLIEGWRDALRFQVDSAEWKEIQAGTEELLEQIRRRDEALRKQRAGSEQRTVDPVAGLRLEGWIADADNDAATVQRIESPGHSARLRLVARGPVVAGWTWTGTLPAGNLRLEARGRVEAFKPTGFGGEGGVFLQLDSPTNRVWSRPGKEGDVELALPVRIGPEARPVRIRLGFRGAGGTVEIEEDSLRARWDR